MNMKHKNRKSLTLGKMLGVGFGYAIIVAGLSESAYGQVVTPPQPLLDSPIACTAPSGESMGIANRCSEDSSRVYTDGSIAIGDGASVRLYESSAPITVGTLYRFDTSDEGLRVQIVSDGIALIVVSLEDNEEFDVEIGDIVTPESGDNFNLDQMTNLIFDFLGDNSIAIGTDTIVTGTNSVAIGSSATVGRSISIDDLDDLDDLDDYLGDEVVRGILTGDINGDGVTTTEIVQVSADNNDIITIRSLGSMDVVDLSSVTEGFNLQLLSTAAGAQESGTLGLEADNAVAIGADASVTGTGGIAIGYGVTSGENEIHIGNSLAISTTDGTVIGAGALVSDGYFEGTLTIEGLPMDVVARVNSDQTITVFETASQGGDDLSALIELSIESGLIDSLTDSLVINRGAPAPIPLGATTVGATAVAIGTNTQVYGNGREGGTAIGAGALVSDTDGIAIGRGANSGGEGGTAIGAGASVTGTDGIAIGRGVTSGEDEIHIGRDRVGETPGQTSVRIGSSLAISTGGTAVGADASITDADGMATGGTAIGAGALVSDTDGIAIGRGATSNGEGGTAIGAGASVTGTDGIAIGYGVTSGEDEIHIGRDRVGETPGQTSVRIGSSLAISTGGTAIGAGASITDADGIATDGTAIGEGASVTGTDGIAIGRGVTSGANEVHIGSSLAISTDGTAIGADASVTGTDGIAIGRGANSGGEGGTAIGAGASVTGTDGIAIGYGVTSGENEIHIGREGQTSVRIGSSLAISTGGTAVGAGASITDADGITTDGTAIGEGASVTGTDGIAIGYGVTSGEDEIHIGRGRVDDIPGQTAVRIGDYSLGTFRTDIANNVVAIGNNRDDINRNAQDITDNAQDITDNAGGIVANFEAIGTNRAGINTNTAGINRNAQGIATNAQGIDNNRAGIATAVALASLPIISGARGGWSIAAGTYDSETAIAVGANFNVRQNATIRFAISTSSGETSGAIGFGMGF